MTLKTTEKTAENSALHHRNIFFNNVYINVFYNFIIY